MRAPLIIFILTGIAIIALSLMRRKFFLAGLVSGIFAGVIALFVIAFPMDEALSVLGLSIRLGSRWQVLGRSFVLDEGNRAAIGYLYLAGGFILAGSWTAKPTRMFYPLGLGMIGLVAASLMIDPFLFAAFFIELSAIVASLILSSRYRQRSRGGMRLLSLYTLAMFAILIVGWIIDVSINEIEIEGLSDRIFLLLGFGFSILLSIPPFHSWIPIATEENHPFTWTFVAIVLHGAALFFAVRFLNTFTWINESEGIHNALRISGGTMALLGAIWAFAQRSELKMGGYALLSDLGVMLIAMSMQSEEGIQLAMALTGARVISMACMAQGLTQIWNLKRDGDSIQEHQAPSTLGAVAFIVGIISLGGFPLTAGFPSRWGIMELLAEDDPFIWIAIIGSMGLICGVGIRAVRSLLFNIESEKMELQGWRERIFLGGGILLTIIFGAFPQLILTRIITALATSVIQMP